MNPARQQRCPTRCEPPDKRNLFGVSGDAPIGCEQPRSGLPSADSNTLTNDLICSAVRALLVACREGCGVTEGATQ